VGIKNTPWFCLESVQTLHQSVNQSVCLINQWISNVKETCQQLELENGVYILVGRLNWSLNPVWEIR